MNYTEIPLVNMNEHIAKMKEQNIDENIKWAVNQILDIIKMHLSVTMNISQSHFNIEEMIHMVAFTFGVLGNAEIAFMEKLVYLQEPMAREMLLMGHKKHREQIDKVVQQIIATKK